MARLISSLPVVFFLHGLLIATLCQSKSKQPKTEVPFFIFGDSFLDAGNNNYIKTTTLDQANFWPYGETYFRFPTGRFSDGRLVTDFIADLAGLPLIPPFLQPGFHQYQKGVNFASAGAGVLSETFQGSVIDLKSQVRYFRKTETLLRQKLGGAGAELLQSRAVYLFGIGTNDYISPFLTNSSVLKRYSQSEYVGMVIGNLTSVIREIYDRGGRKFGFINLPPAGCIPGFRLLAGDKDGGCFKEVLHLAELHNKELSKLLRGLEKQLNGFKYSLYDFHTAIKKRVENPSKFGFREGKTACCGTGRFRGEFSCGGRRQVKKFELCENPNEFVFWDSYHLTEKLHSQLAHQMWSGAGDSDCVGPFSLKQFFFQAV